MRQYGLTYYDGKNQISEKYVLYDFFFPAAVHDLHAATCMSDSGIMVPFSSSTPDFLEAEMGWEVKPLASKLVFHTPGMKKAGTYNAFKLNALSPGMYYSLSARVS